MKMCSVEGCQNKRWAGGLCGMHRWRLKNGKPMEAPKRTAFHGCSVTGCDGQHYAKGYCNLHWNRVNKTGEAGPAQRQSAPPGLALEWLYQHVAHQGRDCLVWPFARGCDGRPSAVQFNKRPVSACRLMCILAHGEPPFERADAAHRCGKGHEGCVNPNHLRWATRLENVADTYEHDTIMRGERHYAAKLTEDDVLSIRRDSRSMTELAQEYGCSISNISAIKRHASWKHLD